MFRRKANPLATRLRSRRIVIHVWAFTLASAIYILFALPLGLTAYLLLMRGSLLEIAVAVGMVAIAAYLLRPAFEELPPEWMLVDSRTFPHLNQLVSSLARTMGIRTPVIMLNEDFDAATISIGWRRRQLIMLGHPFLSVLTRDEMIAVVAHELAHRQDGAWTRSVYVRNARALLIKVRMFVGDNDGSAPVTRADRIASACLTALTAPLLRTLESCIMFDEACAELVADAIAASHSSNSSCDSALRKRSYIYIRSMRTAYFSSPAPSRFERFRKAYADVTEAEIEDAWRDRERRMLARGNKQPAHFDRLIALSVCSAERVPTDQELPESDQLDADLALWPGVIDQRLKSNGFPHEDAACGSLVADPA